MSKADENRMWAARTKFEQACHAYRWAIMQAFPIGLHVLYRHGDRWLGPYEVVGHESFGTNFRGHIRNIITGKTRNADESELRRTS